MPDAALLAEWGRLSVSALWLPVAAWTALALAVEAALRLGRADAAVGLPVRGAALAALPVALAVPAGLGALAPGAAASVAVFAPAVAWLPEVVVGGPAPEAAVASGPASADVLLGLLVVAAGLAGGAALVRLGRGALGLGRVRRALGAAPQNVQGRLDAACARLGVRRRVVAATAPAGTVPFTLGWRRPLVAVPADLDGDALDVALAHEAAHVRRADFAWHAAQRALTAAFAAHPLVWVLGRGLDLDRERAADAAVLDACPGRRRAYARLLLSYAQHPAPPLALGATPGSSTLKHRIDAMTHPLPPRRRRQLARRARLAGLLTLALAAGLAATTAPTSRVTSDFSWSLDRLVIDETERTVSNSFTALEAEQFDNLILIAEPFGTFTISDRPFPDAEVAGRFVGRRLSFDAGGHSVIIDSEDPYFDAPQDAYVRFTPPTTASRSGLARSMFALTRSLDRRPVSQTAEEMFSGLSAGFTRRASAPLDRDSGQRPTQDAPRDTTDEVYDQPDEWPELIGGLESLQERLVYPEAAKEASAEGRAVLQFVVDTDGTVTDVEVLRSTGNDALDRAAVEAVRASRFRPGRVVGEPVRVRFAVPITFRLPAEGDGPPRPPAPPPPPRAPGPAPAPPPAPAEAPPPPPPPFDGALASNDGVSRVQVRQTDTFTTVDVLMDADATEQDVERVAARVRRGEVARGAGRVRIQQAGRPDLVIDLD